MKYKFVAFDLDGVLVAERSSWEWVHRHFGVDNTEAYYQFMNGQIDDHEFMRRDVALWKEIDPQINITKIGEILKSARLVDGSKDTIQQLKKHGTITGIVSGGIDILAEYVGEMCDMDHVMSNGLECDENGVLLGGGILRVPLLDKAKVLREMLAKVGIQPDECAVVGNSCIDICMFEVASFSIAFNPIDEDVKKAADLVIESENLTDILPHLT